MKAWSKIATLTAACVLATATANAANITVVSSGGPLPDVMGTLLPMFDGKMPGNNIAVSFKGQPAILADIKKGGVDVVITNTEIIGGLPNEIGNSKALLMISKVGIAVKAGAAKPDISTPEKLKAALLAAKTVGYSQGASGQHFLAVIQKLGIADAIKAKAVIAQGEPVGAVIAKGMAEIGVQQVAELLPVSGIDFVGPMPGELQKRIPYSAGIPVNAKEPQAAQALVKFLQSDEAKAVLKRKGMDLP